MPRKMKDSGIEWIGQIPEDWKVARMERGLEEIVRRNNPIRVENILSLTKDKGVIPYEDKGNQGNKSKTDLVDYKIAYENTIVMNSMNVIIGSVGLSNYRGCVSPVYYVFKAKDNNDIRFFNYICQLPAFQSELKKYANGILEIRLRVSSYNVLKRNIPFPSYDEQKKISDKLDIEVRYIDGIKLKITQQIETLEDYKKSVITEAVTKGLDKNVEMKDSGIEWIGEIPKHWSKIKLRYLSSIVRGGSPRPINEYMSNSDEGLNWIKIGDTQKGSKYINKTKNKLKVAGLSSTTLVKKGELILSNSMSYGEAYILNIDGCIHDGWLAFKDIKNVDKEYLYFSLLSFNTKIQFDKLSDGGVVQNLNIDKVKTVSIFLPDKKEQVEIANYLNTTTKSIDKSIESKQKQLEILEEYKKSLIYEYVTGKKEVGDVETI